MVEFFDGFDEECERNNGVYVGIKLFQFMVLEE